MKKKQIHSKNSERKLDKNTPFAVTEAYKTVRTNVIFSLAANNHKAFVVSSANAAEGKSTTSANLAITLAQTSARVLLIDADLRKPTQHKIFQVDNRHGLSNFLVGLESLADALHANVEPKLDLLTSGPIPPNPSELLGSKNMGILLEKLEEHYDYIVIDSPPVNVVADALVISAKTAGVVLVAKHCSTTYDDVGSAVDAIRFANSNILGVIFNDMLDTNNGMYYKGYKKYRRYGGYGKYGTDYGYQYGHTVNEYPDVNVTNINTVNESIPSPASDTIMADDGAETQDYSQTIFRRHPEA